MNYNPQIETVLHYINTKIQQNWLCEPKNAFNEVMSIDRLAETACLSKRNFQLFFKSYTGESAGKYINRVRLEYAGVLLKENRCTQQEIAERTGWANDTAYYNAFKKWHGQSPVKYKREKFGSLAEMNFERIEYRIEELSETPIVFFMYTGSYGEYVSDFFEEESWDKLYEFAQANDLLPEREEFWGICYDDREITEDEKCRFYAGVTVKNAPKLRITDSVKTMVLPKGKYAVYTHKGAYEELDLFYNAILQQLPEGHALGEGLILERYLNSSADTSESDLLTEVLLPIVRVE